MNKDNTNEILSDGEAENLKTAETTTQENVADKTEATEVVQEQVSESTDEAVTTEVVQEQVSEIADQAVADAEAETNADKANDNKSCFATMMDKVKEVLAPIKQKISPIIAKVSGWFKSNKTSTPQDEAVAAVAPAVDRENLLNMDITPKKERLLSIDRLRGLCMFGMVCSVILPMLEKAFSFLGPLLDHYTVHRTDNNVFNLLPNVSLADIFAPIFIFVIGLTMILSFKSREQKVGTTKAYIGLATRYFALIGIGCSMGAFEQELITNLIKQPEFVFSELLLPARVYIVGFWGTIALLSLFALISIIKFAYNTICKFDKSCKFESAKFCKVTAKCTSLTSSTLRYFLAVVGAFAVYFLIVNFGELTRNLQYPDMRFGWPYWDTLQNIGLAGLVAIPFVKCGTKTRLAVAGLITVIMSILVHNGLDWYANSETLLYKVVEGGFPASFCWGSIILFASVFYDWRNSNKYWVLAAFTLLAALVLLFGFEVSAYKRGCTPPYALFSVSIGAIVWGLLNKINHWKPRFDFFAIWGSNAILTYIVTKFFFEFIIGGTFGEELSTMNFTPAFFLALGILVAFTIINWFMRKKKIYIRM